MSQEKIIKALLELIIEIDCKQSQSQEISRGIREYIFL